MRRVILPVCGVIAAMIATMIATLIATSGAALAAPMVSPFRAGNWSGGTLVNEHKAFERCVATSQDAKGNAVTFAINNQLQWSVALSNATWNFVRGASLGVLLKIGDSADVISANALATDKSTLDIQVKDVIGLFAKLRAVREFRVAAGGLILELQLGAGDEALAALTQCALRATRFRQNVKPKNAIFDVRNPSPREAQEEAKSLIANILAYAPTRDAQLLPAVEGFADVPVDAAWKVGLVTIGITVLGTTAPLQDVEDALIERGVRACKGGFFFITSDDTLDQSPVARIYTTCQTPEAATTFYHFVVDRPKGGFYVLTMRSAGASFGGVAQKASDDYEARIRSVLSVSIKKLEE